MLEKIKDWILKHITSFFAPLPIIYFLTLPTLIYKGVMLMPIIWFFTRRYDERFLEDLRFLFRPEHIPGWIVTFFGLIILLIALTNMMRKKNELVTSALYGKVRHPQYLGFIVMGWGISAVSIFAYMGGFLAFLFHYWVVMSSAYVALAYFEEWYLLKKHPEEYKKYKEKVPFLFPVPHSEKTPQPIFDLGIIVLFSFILLEIYPEIIRFLLF